MSRINSCFLVMKVVGMHTDRGKGYGASVVNTAVHECTVGLAIAQWMIAHSELLILRNTYWEIERVSTTEFYF